MSITRTLDCPPGGNRTPDPLLKRELLYQLSYRRIYLFQNFKGTALPPPVGGWATGGYKNDNTKNLI